MKVFADALDLERSAVTSVVVTRCRVSWQSVGGFSNATVVPLLVLAVKYVCGAQRAIISKISAVLLHKMIICATFCRIQAYFASYISVVFSDQ